MRRASGFTLIELVIVMIVIGVGLVGITATFSNSAKSLTTNETLQQATQYAQECAEKVIATRRSTATGAGFASISNTTCDTMPALPAGFSRTVSVTTVTGSPCPSVTNNCENVLVMVTNGSLSSSITIMLVN